MDVLDTINLIHVLIIVLPGFFLLKGYGYKPKSIFEHLMLSTFWGIFVFMLMEVLHIYVLDAAKDLQDLIEQPYAGAIIFSIGGLTVGWIARKIAQSPKFKHCVRKIKSAADNSSKA